MRGRVGIVITKLSVGILVLLIGTHAYADIHYRCMLNEEERIVSVIYGQQNGVPPCEVRYQKDGDEQVLWRTRTEQDFCARKAAAFVQQLENWHWLCKQHDTTQAVQPMVSEQPVPPRYLAYQQQHALAQTLAAAAAMKMEVMSYRYQYGRWPAEIDDLGYTDAQMKTSTMIRDMRITRGGVIRVLAAEKLGEHAAVVLTPVDVLGGQSIEWRCETNVSVSGDLCRYQEGASFYR